MTGSDKASVLLGRAAPPPATPVVWIVLWCLLSGGIEGQDLVQELAREVCSCLSAEELVYPNLQADRCLTTVIDAYPRQIRTELQLSVRKADDRKALEAMLIDPLTSDCQVLKNLQPEPRERELHYSDFLLAKKSVKVLGKHPAPDAPSRIVAAEPESLYLRARVLKIGYNELEVRGPGEQVYQLLITDRKTRRQLDLEVGKTYTLEYAFNWRTSDGAVLRELLDVR